jgi:DivIVA domain-containing protein
VAPSSSSSRFTRVPRTAKGYEPAEVDEFFARAKVSYERERELERGGRRTGVKDRPLRSWEVRTAAFGLVRAGYDVQEVDAALDRLEDAVASRERTRLVRDGGEDALLDELARRARTLQGRLDRPAGKRFGPPRSRFERGYDVGDVDALCDKLNSYFNDGEPMSADEVRRAVFRPRRGSGAYREPEVDAFLDRAVAIMVSVD